MVILDLIPITPQFLTRSQATVLECLHSSADWARTLGWVSIMQLRPHRMQDKPLVTMHIWLNGGSERQSPGIKPWNGTNPRAVASWEGTVHGINNRPKHLSLMVPTQQHQGMMSRIKDSQAPGSTRTRIEHPSIAAWCTPHVQQRIAPNATSDRNGRLCG
ncbi:hypothetical protein HBH70_029390 [Parastagonospora nodorum]|nr:hypothetical protein HBH53_036860 [Parastagonospora nodorum]KAH3984433.1 hypothetical protein HBH51_027000 [Parastagonospora nodorum]KAH4259261.1 hypothetical protein HBI04_214810 [Parastagonospora nodorum]KAH4288052.1 hypothetical protein HBI01_224700 [Parastagonospora nodorum]KAH4305054.1 hypothetical protein HBI02_123680 [Parastagonospora nodorum]